MCQSSRPSGALPGLAHEVVIRGTMRDAPRRARSAQPLRAEVVDVVDFAVALLIRDAVSPDALHQRPHLLSQRERCLAQRPARHEGGPRIWRDLGHLALELREVAREHDAALVVAKDARTA